MSYQALWLAAFALTLTVEAAVAIPLLRRADPSLLRRALAVLFANLASHPIVWFVVFRVAARALAIPLAEAWAVGSEAVLYALIFPALGRTRALAVSALANSASYVVGLVVQQLF